jgi:hypothetical protein
MRKRFQLSIWRGLLFLGLAAGLVVVTQAAAAKDSLVFFKNGRVLRVIDIREEADWVFLVVSEPRATEKEPDEEGANEIGVRADSIARIEEAGFRRPRREAIANAGRSANGPVREHTEADSRAAALSSSPGGGTMAEAMQKVPNVPAAGSPEAKLYVPATNPPEIEPGKSIAGWAMKAPLRNLRPPRHLLKRAKALNEQRRLEKERARAAGELQEYSPPTGPVGTGVYDPHGILARQREAAAQEEAASTAGQSDAPAAGETTEGSKPTGQDDSGGPER